MLRQKPRRLQYATGILSRAAFRIHEIQNHISGRDGWIRTSECRRQRPMPYRLATPPYSRHKREVPVKNALRPCRCSASRNNMGWVKGLEPSTLGTTIRCSNQLSYTHHIKFAAYGRVWHARRDSFFCGKTTAVKTIHWIVFKSRLSNPWQSAHCGWHARRDSNPRPTA